MLAFASGDVFSIVLTPQIDSRLACSMTRLVLTFALSRFVSIVPTLPCLFYTFKLGRFFCIVPTPLQPDQLFSLPILSLYCGSGPGLNKSILSLPSRSSCLHVPITPCPHPSFAPHFFLDPSPADDQRRRKRQKDADERERAKQLKRQQHAGTPAAVSKDEAFEQVFLS